MIDGLWPCTIWIWNGQSFLEGEVGDAFVRQVASLPGERGVIIKAADGEYTSGPYGPWRHDIVERFRSYGVGVGLWVFNYGRGKATYGQKVERHSVEAELAALERALAAATPDAVVLNIEDQVMSSPNPYDDVATLVDGAKAIVGGPVGISTVWHWADSMGWPFQAAVGAGVDYWSNQVYAHDWTSYTDYGRLYNAHAGGKPDYISLWANGVPSAGNTVTAAEMGADGVWARDQGAPGVAWWSAQHMEAEQWRGMRAVAELFDETPAPPLTGIEAAMAARGDEPVGPEEYLHHRLDGYDIISVRPGRLGLYWYHPVANRIAFTAWEA